MGRKRRELACGKGPAKWELNHSAIRWASLFFIRQSEKHQHEFNDALNDVKHKGNTSRFWGI